jgi:hypothetical protein
MKKTFVLTITLFVVLVGGLVFFIRGGGLLHIVAGYAGSSLNQPLSIGSIHLEKGIRIIVRDVTVTEKKKGDPRIFLPETEVFISLDGIKNRTIDELIITKPELLLTSWSNKKGDMSLPVDFNKVSIKDGTVIVSTGNNKDITMNEIQLSLQRQEQAKTAELKATARVPGFISKADVEAIVDVRNMNISEAHIEVGGTDLGALFSAAGPEKTDLSVEGMADINVRIENGKQDSGGTFRWGAEVSVRDLFVRSGTVDVKPEDGPIRLKSDGIFTFNNSVIEVNTCAIQLGGSKPWQLTGTLGNILSENPDISMVLTTGDTSLHEAIKIISGPSVTRLHAIDFKANGTVRLEISGKLRAPAFSAAAHIKGEYLKTDNMRIAGFETTLPVDYKDNLLTMHKLAVHMREASFFNAPKDLLFRMNGLQVLVPRLDYRQGQILPVLLHINSDNAVVYSSGREVFSENGIMLKGMVDADVTRPTVMLNGLSLEGASIKGVSGEVSLHQEKSPAIDASFSWKDIDIKALEQKALSSFLKEQGLSIHGTGNVHTTFRMSEGDKGKSHVAGSIHMNVTDAGYSSANETNIGEGIQGELSGSYEIPLPVDRIDFTVQSYMTDFELLSGKFYGNFKNKKISFSGEGSYAESLRAFNISRSEAGLTGIGKIFFSGKASFKDTSPFIDGEIRITEIANHEAFNFLLRETYKERFPFLSEIEIDGLTSARFSVNGSPDRFTVRGDIGIRDMNIVSGKKNHAMSGIHISLPVDLSYPLAGEPAPDGTYGFVRVQDISWGSIDLKDMEFFPAVRQNALVLKDDVSIRLFGGDIVLRDILYSHLLSPERVFRLAVDMRNIRLAEASASLNIPEFNGTLSGTIPRAVFSKGRLSTDGEIILELFDGRMRISDLSVDNVLSPVASIQSGIEIDDINLGKLTGTFDFGHISGVISGRIKDLVMVNGQAQSFTARFETVRQKGVNQKISVKALKKISILGTGTSASVLDRSIYRFFKEYRYEKMGFDASLNNDNLLLYGLESTGNVGYLVKGGFLPPKVDVINYTQNISFKEMLKRLKRIGQTK